MFNSNNLVDTEYITHDDNMMNDGNFFVFNASLSNEEKRKMITWYNNLTSEEKQYVRYFMQNAVVTKL